QKDASDDERNKRERREKSPEGRTIEEKAIALRRVRDGKLREIANALSGNRIDEDQAAQTRRQIEKEYQEAMGLLGPEAQKFLSRETICPTVASADVRIGSGERQRSPERRKEIGVEGEKEREKERKRKFEERWNATGKRFNAEKFRINPDTVKEMKGLIEEVQQIFVAEEGRKFISKNKKEFASVIGDVDPNELDGDRVWELVWNRQDFRGQIEGSLKWNQLDGLRDMLGKYSKGDLPPEVRVLLFKELSRAQGVRQEVLVELWEKIEGRKLDEQARQGLGTPEDYMQVRQQEILVSQKLAERRTKILVDHAIAMGGTGHVLSLDESEMQRIADDLAQVFKGEAYINQDALYALLEQGYNIRETKKKTGAFWIFGAGDVKLKNRNGETKIIKAKEVRVFFSGLNEKLANETAKEVQAILSEEWKGRFEANKASLISAMAERMPESIVAEIYSKVREELEADFLRQYAEEKKKKGPGQKLEQRLKAEGKDLGALAEKALELSGQDLSEEDQEEAIRGLMGEFGFGVDDAAWGAVKGGRQYATLKQYAAKGKMGWFDGLLKFFDSFVK
ncbi:MAG: hypothetical protein HYV77_04575, partial [Candidatus Wildermuthbacteria bacterium]|nr:hypothetical protein [Candidatus Wildermuthbacteria bacterium]